MGMSFIQALADFYDIDDEFVNDIVTYFTESDSVEKFKSLVLGKFWLDNEEIDEMCILYSEYKFRTEPVTEPKSDSESDSESELEPEPDPAHGSFHVFSLQTSTNDQVVICLDSKQYNYARKHLICKNKFRCVFFVGFNCAPEWDFANNAEILEECHIMDDNPTIYNTINSTREAKNALRAIDMLLDSAK